MELLQCCLLFWLLCSYQPISIGDKATEDQAYLGWFCIVWVEASCWKIDVSWEKTEEIFKYTFTCTYSHA